VFHYVQGSEPDGSGPHWKTNTKAIQKAIDTATNLKSTNHTKGCIQISGGDYISSDLFLRSHLVFRIAGGSRLLTAVNHTTIALLHISGVRNVELTGPGTVHGNAEHYISYYDPTDDR